MCVCVCVCERSSPFFSFSSATIYKKKNLDSFCFEPSQSQRFTSGLDINFIPSPSYSFHKLFYHKSCFVVVVVVF